MDKGLVSSKFVMAALCALGLHSMALSQGAGNELKILFGGKGQVFTAPNANLKTEFTGKPVFSDTKKGVLIDSEGISASNLQITGPELMNAKQGTIAFWMKPTLPLSDGKRHYVLTATSAGSENALCIFIEKDGGLYLQTKRDGTWLSPHFNFSWWNKPSWQENVCYHVAVTWAPNAKTKFYVNGSLVHDDASAYPGFDSTLDNLAIGSDGRGGSQINSILREIILSGRVMTQAEISKFAENYDD